MSLTLSSPAIMTQAGSLNLGNNAGMGSKRGRLLIRQQRVKKDGDQGGDLETPEAGVYSDYLLSVPSSGAKMERHASEPSPATSSFISQQSITGQNLLSVPSHSSTSYLVKQHSHPLLPSQSTPGTSYTLTRQLSYPTQTTSHSQTIVSNISTHAAQEIVASGQLLQLQHHKPVRSHTMPQYTITEMELGNERQQISGSPTVVIIPDMSGDQQMQQQQQHSTHVQQQQQQQVQQPPHQKQSQHHLQLPSIRVKNEELQRSISSPLASTRSDLSFETTTRSSHCPTLRPGPALGCNFCWNTIDAHGRILRRKTKYHCPECQTNLCIVPCFQEYHERQSTEGNEAPVSANKASGLKGLKSGSM